MRSILTATAFVAAAIGGLAIADATPAAAREYPWCSRTSASGFNPSCSFTSYGQCMATVSGQRGDCMQNPALAFNEQRAPRRSSRAARQQQDGWDNGWNNNWNNNGWNERW